MNILSLIGREKKILSSDIENYEIELRDIVAKSGFLVIGGAGSIGQEIVKEIFSRNPRKLHVVDISENNTVELVRDIRSSFGYIKGDFQTFSLDVSSQEFDAFMHADGNYDYVINVSALKHVRSEKDPYTLMRMIDVNIFNTIKTIELSIQKGSKKYFCVSTDKAANPVNMMGASKRIMEMYLVKYSKAISISTARFANVAFSDGSLLYGFNQRMRKRQPIVAPNDIKRYFLLPKESAELCLISCIFGKNGDIFFAKPGENLPLVSLAEIAKRYLEDLGYQPYICKNEKEARDLIKSLPERGKWPCLFESSDTTGEKDFEEFYTKVEELDMNRFQQIGIIKNHLEIDEIQLNYFKKYINNLRIQKAWTKKDILDIFLQLIPDFKHKETGKYLESKM